MQHSKHFLAVDLGAPSGRTILGTVTNGKIETEELTRSAYLSSGTWSLMGIETRKPVINEDSYRGAFTNEAGIDGTTTFLKNMCGMWIYERCRKEWQEELEAAGEPAGELLSHRHLLQEAKAAGPTAAASSTVWLSVTSRF